ncbi:hypothetical protein LINGRAHAP2_LOCUS24012, partial [Linum grandiflorum]
KNFTTSKKISNVSIKIEREFRVSSVDYMGVTTKRKKRNLYGWELKKG